MTTLGFQSQVIGQMLPEDLQETNERRFAKKHLNKYLDDAMDTWHSKSIKAGVEIINTWLDSWLAPYTGQCSTEKYHKIKSTRLKALKELDLTALVKDILGCIALNTEPVLLVTVAGQCAARLGWSDRKESLLTVSELIAVLKYTKTYIIEPETDTKRMKISNLMELPEELLNAIQRAKYLPPMVSCPEDLTTNYQSAYRTFNDSLILGKGNSHDEDICLDVINTQNQIPLKLALDFLCIAEEEPNPGSLLDTGEKYRDWMSFKIQSYQMYSLMQKQGNQFYVNNKVDCRGRIYAQGYWINPMGSAFKKASCEFQHEEIVTGYNPL